MAIVSWVYAAFVFFLKNSGSNFQLAKKFVRSCHGKGASVSTPETAELQIKELSSSPSARVLALTIYSKGWLCMYLERGQNWVFIKRQTVCCLFWLQILQFETVP